MIFGEQTQTNREYLYTADETNYLFIPERVSVTDQINYSTQLFHYS